MALRLFIAEKPSLGRAIANGLGNCERSDGFISCNGGNDIVTWCFGHILEQFQPEEYDDKYKTWRLEDLPMVPEKWQMKVIPDKAKQLEIIKKLAYKAETIVNAGDPDREGQLLVDEVLNFIGVLGKKDIQRILVNALDEKSVKQALDGLRDNQEFAGLRNSALARSRADWIIGMNMTRACTIKGRQAGYSSVVSVGRVQTPTLSLIVRREEEIKNFKPVEYYQVDTAWKHENGIMSAIWKPHDDMPGLDADGRLVDREVAVELMRQLSNQSGEIVNVEQKEEKLEPRLPYSLSALQIDAGRKYGYSPQQVLDTQQELYEKKLTTYPRSDCDFLPQNQLSDAPEILKHLSASPELKSIIDGTDKTLISRAWNDKKISAHHAIIPTTVEADLKELTEMQRNLYLLVAKAYLAQFYPAQKYLTTKIDISAIGEDFQASGKVILDDGWKAVYANDTEPEDTKKQDTDNHDHKLPLVNKGDSVRFMLGNIGKRKTKEPKRYTAATLLEAMKKIGKYVKNKDLQAKLKECSGIGTEATRASIIELIQKRGYVKTVKKHLVPTEAAYMMMKLLPESITYPDITAQWEQNLDSISRREIKISEFFSNQTTYVEKMLSEAIAAEIEPPKDLPLCLKCKKPLRRIQSKKNKKYYWVCPNRDCNVIYGDKRGKPDIPPPPKMNKYDGDYKRKQVTG